MHQISTSRPAFVLAGAIAAFFASPVDADDVFLRGSDPFDFTSFNASQPFPNGWSDDTAPTAGNNYFTGGFQLRTPTAGDHVFAGDSLSIDAGGSLLFKSPGVHTVNDLRLNGGSLIQGATGANPDVAVLAGTLRVTAPSRIDTSANGGRTIRINSLIRGSESLTIQGTNGTINWTNPANDFTGELTLGGTSGRSVALVVPSLALGGSVSGLGAASAAPSNLVFDGGTLRVNGADGSITDRQFTVTTAGGTIDSAHATAPLNFTSTAPVTLSGTGTRTFTLTGASTGNNVFAPALGDEGDATTLTKAGTGTWILTGANTYTGPTNLTGGTLQFSSLANLGAGTAINIGGATLRWDAANTVDITSRTVTLTGGTASLNTNGQNITLAGAIGGTGNLTKVGGGVLTLSGENTFTGNVAVGNNNGAIRITNSSALGVGTKTITVTGNVGGAQSPSLRLDGSSGDIILPGRISFTTSNDVTAATGTIVNEAGNNVINGNFSITSGGGGTRFTLSGGTLTLNGNMAMPATDASRTITFSGAGNGWANGNITNTANVLSVTKDGTGTWYLNGANTYNGTTAVNAGTLITSTASTGAGAVTVANNATFGVRVAAPGQSFNTNAITLGTSTGARLSIDLGAFGNPTAPVINAGTVNANGTVTVAVSGTNLSTGSFKLIDYTTIGGAGFNALNLGKLPLRTVATLVHNTTDTSIDLNVTAFDFPKWTGSTSTAWNTTTANWREVNSGNTTTYIEGPEGNDSVLFDDSASTGTVDLTAALSPTHVLVNNTAAREYTFTGTGKLTGPTTVVKQGTGTLILANTGGNDYTGVTTITGGTLQVGNGVTAGAGQLGTGTVLNSAALVFNRPDAATVNTAIQGSGTVAHISSSSLTLNAPLTGFSSVANSGSGNLILAAPLSGPGNVIQSGAGVLSLLTNNSFTGTVTASNGIVRLGHANALGATAGGTTIQGTGTLDLNGLLLPTNEIVTISGHGFDGQGAVINSGPGGDAVGFKNLVLAGDASIGGANRWDIRDQAGGVNGNGFTLTKLGGNEITFRGVGESSLGDIVINGGILRFETNTTMGDPTKTATVNLGGTLAFWAPTAPFAKNLVLNGGRMVAQSGNATFNGPVALGTGGGILDAASGTTLFVNGTVSGTTGFTKLGAGAVELTGGTANTFTGPVTVNAGTLRLNKTVNVTAADAEITVNTGGTLQFLAAGQLGPNATVTINQGATYNNASNFGQAFKDLTINTSTLQTVNNLNLSGTLSFTAGLHDLNSGQSITTNALSISGGANYRLGANSGNTTVNIGAGGLALNNGTLQLGQPGGAFAGQINLGGDVTGSGTSAIFNPNNNGVRVVDLLGATRTFHITDGTTTVRPSLQNGGLTKTGDGELVLTGNSDFTGPTTVNAGALLVNGSLSGTAVTVNSAGTLLGTGTINGPVAVQGALSPGFAPGIFPGTLTLGSTNLTLGSASSSLFELANEFNYDRVVGIDRLTLDGTVRITLLDGFSPAEGQFFDLFDFTSVDASGFNASTDLILPALNPGLSWDSSKFVNEGVLAVIPEPTVALSLFSCAGVLLGLRRRRRE